MMTTAPKAQSLSLSFYQLNIHKSIGAASDLEHCVDGAKGPEQCADKSGPEAIHIKPLICLVTEPHVKICTNRTKMSHVPQGYRALLPRTEARTGDRIKAGTTGNWPRAAILFNSNLNIWPVPEYTSRDCVVAQITLNM